MADSEDASLSGIVKQEAKKNFASSVSQWTNLQAPSLPGLYCIKLDAREELRRESTTRARQFHVASEWWFRVV